MNIKEFKGFIKDLPDEMEVCSKDTKWVREDTKVYTQKVFDELGDFETVILVVE